MPTYEYECVKCAHLFEKFQSMRDAPLKKCPKCGGKVKRLLGTGAAIIFKGKGFYQTDYRSSDYQSAAKADASPPASSSSDSTTSASSAAASKSGGEKTAGRSGSSGTSKGSSSSAKAG